MTGDARRARLPAQCAWADLGVEIVGPAADDKRFVEAVLPDGWRVVVVCADDHAGSAWRELRDRDGRNRADIETAIASSAPPRAWLRTRFRIHARFEDCEVVAYTVEDRGVVPPRVVHEVAALPEPVDEITGGAAKDWEWEIRDHAAHRACGQALESCFPEWKDPTAYWDAGPDLWAAGGA